MAESWAWLVGILNAENAPEWAQAIGAIAAILVTAYIARRQSNRDDVRRHHDRIAMMRLPIELANTAISLVEDELRNCERDRAAGLVQDRPVPPQLDRLIHMSQQIDFKIVPFPTLLSSSFELYAILNRLLVNYSTSKTGLTPPNTNIGEATAKLWIHDDLEFAKVELIKIIKKMEEQAKVVIK